MPPSLTSTPGSHFLEMLAVSSSQCVMDRTYHLPPHHHQNRVPFLTPYLDARETSSQSLLKLKITQFLWPSWNTLFSINVKRKNADKTNNIRYYLGQVRLWFNLGVSLLL